MNAEIAKELAPFFRYATAQNPHVECRKWKEPGNTEESVHRIFLRCVHCNSERFAKDWEYIKKDPRFVRMGTDTYFCEPCGKKVKEVGMKLEKRNYKALSDVWDKYLFGPLTKL